MILYVEELSVKTFLFQILGRVLLGKLGNGNLKTHYYIDASARGERIANFLGKIFGFEFRRLKFELRYIKDDRGELLRLRIPRVDLFSIQKNIIESKSYKSLLRDEWNQGRFFSFLERGVVPIDRDHPESAYKLALIINVIAWHMKKMDLQKGNLFVRNRSWKDVYERYALELGVSIKFLNPVKPLNPIRFFKIKPVRINRKFLVSALKGYPWLFFFLKRVKNILRDREFEEVIVPEKTVYQNSHYADIPKLYFYGRGDVNLRNNGYHSDFFWLLNSDFQSRNVLTEYHSKEERRQLEHYGISIRNSKIKTNKEKKIFHLPPPLENNLYKAEREMLSDLVKSYIWEKSRRVKFFETYGVKVFLTWYKYDYAHMAIGDAIKEVGGILAIWQMAFDGFKSIENITDSDIVFNFSNWSVNIEKQLRSKIEYNIITGYPKDYAAPLLKAEAVSLRRKMESKGARKIVFAIDENSMDDSRWHTGHSMQRENYSFILKKVLETPWLGVVFKPKVAKTLRQRLGEVADLLAEAESTGRCYVYESSGRHTTLAPPLLAGLSADVCIHGHLSSGTAALECALENIPTLLIDREGCPDSKFYELPKGKVIFKDWPDTIDAVMEHFQSDTGIPGFGDWSLIIDEFDPFRDGKAANRIGTYLHWLIQGFEEGLDRDMILTGAAERYAKKWGSDKVISI